MSEQERCAHRDDRGLRCVFGAEHTVDYHLPEYAPGEAPQGEPLVSPSPSQGGGTDGQ